MKPELLKHLTLGQRIKYAILQAIKPLYWKLHNQFLNIQRRIDKANALAVANALFEARKALREAEDSNLSRSIRRLKERQDNCNHLKGSGAVRNPFKDYLVGTHTFPTGEKYIRCLKCSKIWRRGEEGWAEAINMAKTSTNTPTSSEVSMVFPPGHNVTTVSKMTPKEIKYAWESAGYEYVYTDEFAGWGYWQKKNEAIRYTDTRVVAYDGITSEDMKRASLEPPRSFDGSVIHEDKIVLVDGGVEFRPINTYAADDKRRVISTATVIPSQPSVF